MNYIQKYMAVIFILMILTGAQLGLAGELTKSGSGWNWESDQSFSIASGGTLNLEGITGNVEIVSWDRNEVAITEKLILDVYTQSEAEAIVNRLDTKIRKTSGQITISGLSGTARMKQHQFEIRLPVRFNMNLDIKSGNLSVNEVDGALLAGLGGGNIEIDHVSGPVTINLGGGNVEISEIKNKVTLQIGGGNCEISDCKAGLSLNQGGGNLELAGISGNVQIELGGGEIEMERIQGDINFESGGGDITMGQIQGNVRGRLGGGSIEINDAVGALNLTTDGGELDLMNVEGSISGSTAGGDITVKVRYKNPKSAHDIQLKTMNGDIELLVPQNMQATLTATTHKTSRDQEDISSDFQLYREVEDNQIRATGKLNGGGDPILLFTQYGNISIKKSGIQ